MKKLAWLLIIIIIVFSLSACKEETETTAAEEAEQATADTTTSAFSLFIRDKISFIMLSSYSFTIASLAIFLTPGFSS